MEALCHNQFCSEVEIIFNGYSVDLQGTRTIYDYESRDFINREQKEKGVDTNSIDSITDISANETTRQSGSGIDVDDLDPVQTEEDKNSRHEGFFVPIYIDGKILKRKVKKLRVCRLMKND